MLNKVPKVIAIFWIIKVLSTTTGETFADYINETLGFGLVNTTIVMGIAFVAGRNRVPSPAAGITALVIGVDMPSAYRPPTDDGRQRLPC